MKRFLKFYYFYSLNRIRIHSVDVLDSFYFSVFFFSLFLLFDSFHPLLNFFIIIYFTILFTLFEIVAEVKYKFIRKLMFSELLCDSISQPDTCDDDILNWKNRIRKHLLHEFLIFLLFLQLKIQEHPLFLLLLNFLLVYSLLFNNSFFILIVNLLYIISYSLLLHGNYTYKVLKTKLREVNAELTLNKNRIKANYQNSLLLSYLSLNGVSLSYRYWRTRHPIIWWSEKNFFEMYLDTKLFGDLTTNFPFSISMDSTSLNSYSIVI